MAMNGVAIWEKNEMPEGGVHATSVLHPSRLVECHMRDSHVDTDGTLKRFGLRVAQLV